MRSRPRRGLAARDPERHRAVVRVALAAKTAALLFLSLYFVFVSPLTIVLLAFWLGRETGAQGAAGKKDEMFDTIKVEKIVANSLFADGAGALVGAAPEAVAAEGAWSVVDNGTYLMPDSSEAMTWRIGRSCFFANSQSRAS